MIHDYSTLAALSHDNPVNYDMNSYTLLQGCHDSRGVQTPHAYHALAIIW